MSSISASFRDMAFQTRLKDELPNLIRDADLEGSRIGKTGMEKGLVRKKYLISFLKDHFGYSRVEDVKDKSLNIDVKIDSISVKIKTITGKRGVKIKWTIDTGKVNDFFENYTPNYGIILIRINWEMDERKKPSGFFWVPIETQLVVLKQLGLSNYIMPPKLHTNARGVELRKIALETLLAHKGTVHIDIDWRKINK